MINLNIIFDITYYLDKKIDAFEDGFFPGEDWARGFLDRHKKKFLNEDQQISTEVEQQYHHKWWKIISKS